MFWILGALLAALGFHVFLVRRSLSEWLIGSQLVFLSLMTFFVHAGIQRAEKTETQAGALYLVILSAVFTGSLLGLAVRQFILARDTRTERMEAE